MARFPPFTAGRRLDRGRSLEQVFGRLPLCVGRAARSPPSSLRVGSKKSQKLPRALSATASAIGATQSFGRPR
jgi:hypothetical protein